MKKRWILLLIGLILISTVYAGFYNGAVYTNKEVPKIFIPFNEETKLLNVSVSTIDGQDLPFKGPFNDQGLVLAEEWIIEIQTPLIEGTYLLMFTAIDKFENAENYALNLITDFDPPAIETLAIQPSEEDLEGQLIVPSSAPTVYVTLDEMGFVNKAVLRQNGADTELIQNFLASPDQMSLWALIPMTPGHKILIINASDLAGNTIEKNISFIVEPEPLEVSIVNPPYQVSNKFEFNVELGTNEPSSVCKYTHILSPAIKFDTITTPANIFTKTSNEGHTLYSFDLITEENTPYAFYVYCNSSSGIKMNLPEVFNLEVDTTAPQILSAVADPDFVIEFPEVLLVVETDDRARCKYTTEVNTSFDLMTEFDTYAEELFETSNVQEITGLQDETSYDYYVVCENRALNISSESKISFDVNFSANNEITSVEPAYSSESTVEVELRTNKVQAQCEMKGDSLGDSYVAMSNPSDRLHQLTLSGLDDGDHSYTALCQFANGEVQKNYELIVDTTPPILSNVDDKEFSKSKSKLKYEFNATDEESGIDYYLYAIGSEKYPGDNYSGVLNWSQTSSKKGKSKSVDLENGETYYFAVKAVNNVGLESDIVASDGVFVDVGFQEYNNTCFNGLFDPFQGETATDCGGTCSGCGDGSQCNVDTDCLSLLCVQGICNSVLSTCNNLIKDDNETDIDCGGNCNGCLTGKACLIDSDCVSGNCSSNVCQAPAASDYDGDGMPDDWEIANGLDYKDFNDRYYDPDNDGLLNFQEYEFGADPKVKDTDDDGIYDGGERTSGTDMLSGLSVPDDTDNDGVGDQWEVDNGFSFSSKQDSLTDGDNDGFTNFEEYNYNTNPTEKDTDNDGIYDGGERTSGTDPLDIEIVPSDLDNDLMGDGWENKYDLNLAIDDSQKDADSDGYSNFYEYLHNTNPSDSQKLGPKDNDADGYMSDEDCDDNDPLVNPGMKEIRGNGKDDDCDSGTTDKRGPLFFLIAFVLGLIILLVSSGYLLYKYKTFFKIVKPIKQMVRPVVKPKLTKPKVFKMPGKVDSADLQRFRDEMQKKRSLMENLFSKFGPKTKKLQEIEKKRKESFSSKEEKKLEHITYFDLAELHRKLTPKKKDALFDQLNDLRKRAVKQKKPKQEEAFDKLSQFLGNEPKSDLDKLRDDQVFDELVKSDKGKDIIKKLRKLAKK